MRGTADSYSCQRAIWTRASRSPSRRTTVRMAVNSARALTLLVGAGVIGAACGGGGTDVAMRTPVSSPVRSNATTPGPPFELGRSPLFAGGGQSLVVVDADGTPAVTRSAARLNLGDMSWTQLPSPPELQQAGVVDVAGDIVVVGVACGPVQSPCDDGVVAAAILLSGASEWTTSASNHRVVSTESFSLATVGSRGRSAIVTFGTKVMEVDVASGHIKTSDVGDVFRVCLSQGEVTVAGRSRLGLAKSLDELSSPRVEDIEVRSTESSVSAPPLRSQFKEAVTVECLAGRMALLTSRSTWVLRGADWVDRGKPPGRLFESVSSSHDVSAVVIDGTAYSFTADGWSGGRAIKGSPVAVVGPDRVAVVDLQGVITIEDGR